MIDWIYDKRILILSIYYKIDEIFCKIAYIIRYFVVNQMKKLFFDRIILIDKYKLWTIK